MKIRNGFVSNSSSSSFVCDVCGTVESGMDASASDFEMTQCTADHCFCDSHTKDLPETTPQMIRENITAQINECTYTSAEDKAVSLQTLADTEDEYLEDLLRDDYSDDGCPECQCPICTLTALRSEDGYAYLKKKFNLTDANILTEIKADFKTHAEFTKTISSKS
jgi:hypothetical protein